MLGLLAAAGARAEGPADAALARCDAAWERRAEGNDGRGGALRSPIDQAIRACEAATVVAADDPAPHWRLVRALHFAAEFASDDPDEEKARLDAATVAAEAALDALAGRLRGGGGRARLDVLSPDALVMALAPEERTDAAGVQFWSAVAWGAWSAQRGLLDALRQGVVPRVHRHTLAAVALDPRFEAGGAHRLLARLHATLPRVPGLSGWVDRSEALPEMDRALAVGPEHPGNYFLLALTLFDLAPDRRDEALVLLDKVVASPPRPAYVVEDLAVREAARARVVEERDAS